MATSSSAFNLFFLILLFAHPCLVLSAKLLQNLTTIPVPATGPETLIFSLTGEGPYTGVSDGRVVKYEGPNIGFTDFAYVSPNRTKEKCDGVIDDTTMGAVCGRPLGIAFNHRTNEIYIADAFYYLRKVGGRGGLAKLVATSADGIALDWLDGIDVDQNTGIVYFTQASTIYGYPEILKHLSSGESSGRVLSYNPRNDKTEVLIKGIRGPGGVAVSRDSTYILVSATPTNKVYKHWLKGPKAKTTEFLLDLPTPANIKRTLSNHFWIASTPEVTVGNKTVNIPRGVRVDGSSGKILETVIIGGDCVDHVVNDFQEFGEGYYVGSLLLKFAAETDICANSTTS